MTSLELYLITMNWWTNSNTSGRAKFEFQGLETWLSTTILVSETLWGSGSSSKASKVTPFVGKTRPWTSDTCCEVSTLLFSFKQPDSIVQNGYCEGGAKCYSEAKYFLPFREKNHAYILESWSPCNCSDQSKQTCKISIKTLHRSCIINAIYR